MKPEPIYSSKRSFTDYFTVFGVLYLLVLLADWRSDNLMFNQISSYIIVSAISGIFIFISFFMYNRIVIKEEGIELRSLLRKPRLFNWNDINKIEMSRIRTKQFNISQKSGVKKYFTFSTISKKEFIKIASILYINRINITLEGHINNNWKIKAEKSFSKGEFPLLNFRHFEFSQENTTEKSRN